MRKVFVFAIIAISASALCSCSKELHSDSEKTPTPLVLGLECWTPSEQAKSCDTKTYMYKGNTASPSIHWYNTGQDKVIWVFQASTGNKCKYVSTATDDSATRAFVPDTNTNVPDLVSQKDIKYVLWSGGGSPSSDNTTLSGDIIVSGGTLCVPNPQNLNKSQSFQATNANVAVAKPSDTYLKNVMGYIKFVNPSGTTGKATIKSIEFQADEYLSGQIQIDYSGSEPVASIIDNENASKSLVVNARKLNGGAYEAGTWYACLLPGTYHNFKIIVTAFNTEGTTGADDDIKDPFTLNCGTVTIVRSKWSNAGTIPQNDPNAIVWPENTDAFDYGISYPDTKVATIDHDALTDKGWASASSGSAGAKTTEEITMDKVTYGVDSQFITMGGSRPYINTCYNWSTPIGNQAQVPTRRYFSFKVNKPGTLSFFPRYSNSSSEATLRVTLDKTVNGVRSLEYLYNAVPENRTQSAPANNNRATYTITIPVTKSNLSGIDDAATIYVAFASVSAALHYYDITWAPANL